MIKFLGGSGILAKVLRYLLPTVLFNALYGITPDSMYRLPSMRFSADSSEQFPVYVHSDAQKAELLSEIPSDWQSVPELES
ncbi:MAG: hypothetical protein BWY14_01204 [Parcubacteria group bacterium ADurb.Bin192]|nr:MAG: hypothetical protein BWY14_01204 [Parcubacteria group bacterium ADurb.Bin192]